MKDKLYFYSKSKDALPGKGVHEVISNENEYDELKKIKDWRKILSNFYIFPIKYNNYTYNTIEHVFQAMKINIVDSEKAYHFTIESGNIIGKGDGLIARKNRKYVKLNNEELKEWNKIKDNVLYEASLYKFKNCEIAKNVLKFTKNAELWHIVQRSSNNERFIHLENIRALL